MKDEHCVRFLQWVLPHLRMRWPGFRKVRKQLCKRIDRRLRDLNLPSVEEYQAYLNLHTDEWQYLDSLCRITISRFYRDKEIFLVLTREVLPSLICGARERGDTAVRIWSAGCASGEEPYTLAIMWAVELESRFPGMTIDIVATDVDPVMLQRARDARYEFSSLKDLPETWRDQGFTQEDGIYHLKSEYRRDIEFLEQDIRQQQPQGRFDLVLCRNLVFTYFDEALQSELSGRIVDLMHDGAAIVLGVHEHLPEGAQDLSTWFAKQRIYRKISSIPSEPVETTATENAVTSTSRKIRTRRAK
jgi:chemotaxis protein methyltransferase CheR